MGVFIAPSRVGFVAIRSRLVRSKLNIRYFFIKQYTEEHGIKVEYVKTSDMVADIFTKPLQGEQFVRLRNRILGLIPVSEESE
jgi:hypothetical protein